MARTRRRRMATPRRHVRILRQPKRGNHVRAEIWLGQGRPAGVPAVADSSRSRGVPTVAALSRRWGLPAVAELSAKAGQILVLGHHGHRLSARHSCQDALPHFARPRLGPGHIRHERRPGHRAFCRGRAARRPPPSAQAPRVSVDLRRGNRQRNLAPLNRSRSAPQRRRPRPRARRSAARAASRPRARAQSPPK